MDTFENPITGDSFRVAKADFPDYMNFEEAKKACASLGNGWRLPTEMELKLMFKNKEKLNNIKAQTYWSSTEKIFEDETTHRRYLLVYQMSFSDGYECLVNKENINFVRAVTSF